MRWKQSIEEEQFEEMERVLSEIGTMHGRKLKEMQDLFARVSCRVDVMLDVLSGKEGALSKHWTVLEDMALKHEPEAQEY